MLRLPEAVGEAEALKLPSLLPVTELLLDSGAEALTEPHAVLLGLRLTVLQRLTAEVGLPELLGTAAELETELPDMLELLQPLPLTRALRELDTETVEL
jgi:hypothetical protein